MNLNNLDPEFLEKFKSFMEMNNKPPSNPNIVFEEKNKPIKQNSKKIKNNQKKQQIYK
jgi:hypothetical protein